MKNNIILILVVTVISIAVIIISVAVSAGKGSDESSSPSRESRPSSSAQTTTAQPTEEPPAPESVPQTSPASPRTEDTSEPERFTDEQTAGNILSLARSLIGTPFTDGGDSPVTGFDNSGFIYYVLRENGYITCPRGVLAQSEMGAALEYSELQPGDLVFFSESGVSAEFGGIYAGNGTMIACLMPGTQVKEVNITSDYYTRNFFRGVAIS